MYMDVVTISPKYQVVIPSSIRTLLGIHPGEKLSVVEKDGIIRFVRLKSLKNLKGRFAGIDSKDVREHGERC